MTRNRRGKKGKAVDRAREIVPHKKGTQMNEYSDNARANMAETKLADALAALAKSTEESAAAIARDLFTDGMGGEACRLVMEYPDGPKYNASPLV